MKPPPYKFWGLNHRLHDAKIKKSHSPQDCLHQAQKLNESLGLSHYEIQLLNLTARAHFLEKPIFVGDLIYQRHIASQATLHASAKKLILKELSCIKPHEGDGRTKELKLTELALERYKKLQKVMRRALTK